jgi:protein melted
MGSSGGLGLGKGSSSNGGLYSLNQSTGSIGVLLQQQQQQNSISVHHASPASPTFNNHQTQSLITKLPAASPVENNNQVIVSGPATVTSRRNDNKSVTLLNSTGNQRMSVFEPYPMRDTIQHFCEKHLDKIKAYMDSVGLRLPPPAKCTIEERRAKKLAKLHFACQVSD